MYHLDQFVIFASDNKLLFTSVLLQAIAILFLISMTILFALKRG